MTTIFALSGKNVGAEVIPSALSVLEKVCNKYNIPISIQYQEGTLHEHLTSAKKVDVILTGPLRLTPLEELAFFEEFAISSELRTAICYPQLLEKSPLKKENLGEGFNISVISATASHFLPHTIKLVEDIADKEFHSTIQLVENGKYISPSILSSLLLFNQSTIKTLLVSHDLGDMTASLLAELSGTPQMQASAYFSNKNRPPIFEATSTFLDLYAGKGTANPISAFQAVAHLLRYQMKEIEASNAVEGAISAMLAVGARTVDLAPHDPFVANTQELTTMMLKSI